MTEQPKQSERIRGHYPWDVKGMVFTELHSDHQLSKDGFRGISLQVEGITKYFYFDNRSLRDVEETMLELWLNLRNLRKTQSADIVIIKTVK